MSINVLFVDDEPNILQGLRRTLRPMRHEWSMRFASGGGEALEMLEEMAADAIVSDMRMPGMDGGAFLTRVAEAHPESIRFVLSGQADKDATLSVVGPSHQFLPKPCDKDVLTARINQCLDFRQTASEHDPKHQAAQLPALISPSRSLRQLSGLMQAGSATLDDLATFISLEPALSAKVLQLATNAYFGIGNVVHSARQAVGLLGFDVLIPLMERKALAQMTTDTVQDEAVEDLVAHARACAAVAVYVAQELGLKTRDMERARTAALLLNIGRFAQLSRAKSLDGPSTDTRMIGCYLTALWGLPQHIAWPIRYAHVPHCCPGETDGVLAALHIAHASAQSTSPKQICEKLDEGFLAPFNLKLDFAQLLGPFEGLGDAA